MLIFDIETVTFPLPYFSVAFIDSRNFCHIFTLSILRRELLWIVDLRQSSAHSPPVLHDALQRLPFGGDLIESAHQFAVLGPQFAVGLTSFVELSPHVLELLSGTRSVAELPASFVTLRS